MTTRVSIHLIETAAHAAHEANRAYCRLFNELHPTWDALEYGQRFDARQAAQLILETDATPEQVHEQWLARKTLEGWTLGAKKVEAIMTHPALRPYAELEPHQRYKNEIFCTVVKVIGAGDWRVPA